MGLAYAKFLKGPSRVVNSAYEFGDFRLDARKRTLERRSGGEVVEVTPKAYAALLYLVERANEPVSKRELMAALWPNVVVEDSNLTQAVHTLRRVLGEAPGDHRYIVTIPGRGYQFVAQVKRVQEGAVDSPTLPPAATPAMATVPPGQVRSRQPAMALIVATIVLALGAAAGYFWLQREPAGTSIAVLPFSDEGTPPGSMHLAKGVAQEITQLLRKGTDLRVFAAATSKDSHQASHVLRGTVHQDGELLHIEANFIEVASGSVLWSRRYDRSYTDLAAIEQSIAASVTNQLRSTIGLADTRQLAANATALDHLMRGYHYFERRQPGDMPRARAEFESALALDPLCARSWAGVASTVHVQMATGEVAYEEGLPRMRDAAMKAVSADPTLPDGFVRLAAYHQLVGDEALAGRAFLQAAELDPEHPLVQGGLAGTAAAEGRLDEAIDRQQKLAARFPHSNLIQRNLGVMLYAANRMEEARIALMRANALEHTSDVANLIGQILILQGKPQEALALAQRETDGHFQDHLLALAYRALGQQDLSDAALARLVARAAQKDPLLIAEVHAQRDDEDEALSWMERAATRVESPVPALPAARGLWELRRSPWFASMHDHPRWQALFAGEPAPG